MNELRPHIDNTHPLRLGKRFKLRHKSLVNNLFSNGKSVCEYPLRAVYRFLDSRQLADTFINGVPERIDRVQMMITVPKKKRRHAVDRVLMRRRIREAFRTNRLPLSDAVARKDIYVEVAFIYQHNDNIPYSRVQQSMVSILSRIIRKAEADAAEEKTEDNG